jgi:murein DD-endopeptidase MepM/ murein hydrolase activator NlpD
MSGWKAAHQPRQSTRHRAHTKQIDRRAALPDRGAGYTIGHRGRQIRLAPVAFWIAIAGVVVMAGWSVATASYFAFRNDLLKGLIARAAEQQYAYEDRIAELRARIDRTTSRQLLDQEQFEQKLDDLLRREATLESRSAALVGIADAPTGSLRSSKPGADALATAPARTRRSALEPAAAPASRKAAKDATDADIGGRLSHLEGSLDRVERRQTVVLAQMQERYEGKARRLRGVLADLGLKLEPPAAASGGPFVPIKLPGEGNGFERALTRVNIARAQAEQMSRSLVWVPLRKPVTGEIDVSSTFGVRVDPFLHIPAMHTGIDFRGDVGDAVHATAAGTVANAGWSGGYGKMVEIDHGNGLSTRYGHLSEIDVKVGDDIRIGEVVGHMGSTGRSTGPHLHYETRVDGEAVDPQKFLDAGDRLHGQAATKE